MSGTTVAAIRQAQAPQTHRLQKEARKIRSGLQVTVKISSDGDFTARKRLLLPKMETLMRRGDRCDLLSYTLPLQNWFRVFFRNNSHKAVLLCPTHIDGRNVKLEMPTFTVQPGEERDLPLSLVLFPGEREQRLSVYGENNHMLLELRFGCLKDEPETFSLAPEDPETDDSDSDDYKPPVPKPTSALAVAPRVTRSHTQAQKA